MGKPLLTLETLAPDRPTVAIDGTEYELAMPGDFSIRDEAENARLLRKGMAMLERAQAGEDRDEVDQETNDELEELLGGVVDVILKAPAAVKARLRWRQKLAIIQAFSAAVTPAAPAPRTEHESRSTSATSPRGSRRRTAPRTGSGSLAGSSSR